VFTACIFCHRPLGTNEAVEHFPVGRRLAFDAARGRLWVVCRSCERWNLTPLEVRWEAIEECERLYRDTRLRVSTDQIGLARLPEGLELVRIGAPQRPEFAAWRYGDQFGRRRRRAFLVGGGVALASGAVILGASVTGVGLGGFGWMWGQIPNIINSMRKVRLRTADGRVLVVRGNAFSGARLRGVSGEPVLSFKHRRMIEYFRGPEALRHAARLLPAINASGGSKRVVQDAVRTLEARRGSEAYLDQFFGGRAATDHRGRERPILRLPAPTRLALEMALHEEAERRAIEGELTQLLAAWREAEEIAGIADDLFLPAEVEARLAELKRGVGPRGATPPAAP
jgi:hypothetical protein